MYICIKVVTKQIGGHGKTENLVIGCVSFVDDDDYDDGTEFYIIK